MKKFDGTPVSPGKITGKVYVYQREKEAAESEQEFKGVDEEMKDFKEAVEKSKEQIESLREKASERYGEDKAKIFDAHLLVLEDPTFAESVGEKIKEEEKPTPVAVEMSISEVEEKFSSLESDYMKERASDIRDIGKRVISNLSGAEESTVELEEKRVILAEELLPSDTVKLPEDKILGFCTKKGGKTAHVSIIARSMGCPAVVGVNAWKEAEDGDKIELDGDSGEVVFRPE